jgi:hypothetical protein
MYLAAAPVIAGVGELPDVLKESATTEGFLGFVICPAGVLGTVKGAGDRSPERSRKCYLH